MGWRGVYRILGVEKNFVTLSVHIDETDNERRTCNHTDL